MYLDYSVSDLPGRSLRRGGLNDYAFSSEATKKQCFTESIQRWTIPSPASFHQYSMHVSNDELDIEELIEEGDDFGLADGTDDGP